MITMRDAFLDELYEIAKRDKRVILLSDDFGALSLDKFREDLGNQFFHIGVAEQDMVNIATGLAMDGKIVYMYAIEPYLPLRCYEQIRIHLSFKNPSITGVGVGAGYAYELSGPTHHSLEDIAAMRALPRITILTASDSVMAKAFAKMCYEKPGPKYVRLDRIRFPPIYGSSHTFEDGLEVLKDGHDLTIIANGYMVHQAFKVRDALARQGVEARIIDLYRLKPINQKLLLENIGEKVVTLEETFIHGGVGGAIAEILCDNKVYVPLLRIATPDEFCFKHGGREEIHRSCGLDVDGVARRVLEWLE